MSKSIKMAVCQITGEEMPKKQTILIHGHRVSKSHKGLADCLFGDLVTSVGSSYKKQPSSSTGRKRFLIFSAVLIKFVKEYYEIDPSSFIMSAAKRYNIHATMVEKLLDYAYDEPVRELESVPAKKSINFGYTELMKQINRDKV